MLIDYFSSLKERKKKAFRPSVMISKLSALCCLKTLTGRYDALLHTVYLWGLLESMCTGFLLHYRLLWSYYAYLLCYIDFVWFVNMYRTLCSQKSDANWLTSSFQLRPITVSCCICLLIAAFLWCEMGWVSLYFFYLMASLIFVIVQCIIETLR